MHKYGIRYAQYFCILLIISAVWALPFMEFYGRWQMLISCVVFNDFFLCHFVISFSFIILEWIFSKFDKWGTLFAIDIKYVAIRKQ